MYSRRRIRLILSGILMVLIILSPFFSLAEADKGQVTRENAGFSRGTLEEAVVNAMIAQEKSESMAATSLQERAQVNVKR